VARDATGVIDPARARDSTVNDFSPRAVPTSVDDRAHLRNPLVLAIAAAASNAVPPVLFALGGLTGLYLLGPDKSLATLPLSVFTVGVAVGAFPAAMLMRAVGRRVGFMLGALIAVVGALGCGFAVLAGSFPGFVGAAGVIGIASAFTQQYRFAAADSGSPAFQAKAIAWVLSGGIAAAIIGPQTAILTRNLFAPIPFAGAFFAGACLAAIALFVLSFLSGSARLPPRSLQGSGGRPLAEIVRQPRFIVAVLCAIGSYSMMTLVMTAAPLAMVACGLGEDNAALGIQWHVLAMFGPSFFTGRLIARFGAARIIAVGLVLLAGCAAVALSGIDVAHFWLAIILLGLGWNFGFVGATTMVTTTYRMEERAKVQGFNDLLVFGVVAAASFSSGALFSTVGWSWINLVVFPIVLLCSLALATLFLSGRGAPARP
jgi:MFS family permease